jgi:hypothetical protein
MMKKEPKGRGSLDQKSRADEKIGSGPKGNPKVITQPSGSDDDGELAKRGMTSEAGRKFWKQSGYKVPTDVHGNHHGGK